MNYSASREQKSLRLCRGAAYVRSAIKDWRKAATEQQIPAKLLESYSIRWDEL